MVAEEHVIGGALHASQCEEHLVHARECQLVGDADVSLVVVELLHRCADVHVVSCVSFLGGE